MEQQVNTPIEMTEEEQARIDRELEQLRQAYRELEAMHRIRMAEIGNGLFVRVGDGRKKRSHA